MNNRDVHLAEYTALKTEQGERIKARDGYMYSTLAVVVAAVAAAAQANLPHLLLAVPPACFVLGWTRLRNDTHIVAIRHYLRDQLAPLLHTGDGTVLGWETGPRGRLTTWVQFAADMLTFVVPGILAVIVWGTIAPTTAWGLWLAAMVADAVIIGALAALITRHATTQDCRDDGSSLTDPGS
jgi:hypothetical protein